MPPKSEQCQLLSMRVPHDKPALAVLQHTALPGWNVMLEVQPNGNLSCLTVKADDTSAGHLTRRELRALPLGELLAEVKRQLAAQAKALRGLPRGEVADSFASTADHSLALSRRPGRRGRSDLDYAKLAAAYVTAIEGGSATPVLDIARATHASPSTVRSALHEARGPRRGLLTRPPRGQAGGRLTEKAIALLEASDGEH